MKANALATVAVTCTLSTMTGCMTTRESTMTWDKTFPKSDKVEHRKVVFKNRYGITLSADLYQPKRTRGEQAAIAVGGPFGAVKEQSSGLYAQTLAERGFVTLAFDPSYAGESGGEPRNVASPDINTEDFSAAVDFLGLQPNVDRKKIGIIGICGWGGMALNAAAVDKRIKAVATSTMYDMTRVMSKGYNDSVTLEQRTQTLEKLGQQRWPVRGSGRSRVRAGLPRVEGRRTPVRRGVCGLLQIEDAGFSPTLHQLERLVDAHKSAVVHEHADPDVHRGNFAAAHSAYPWRKGPFALFQRNRLRGCGRAQGTHDHSGRQPYRFVRPTGQNPVRQTGGLLQGELAVTTMKALKLEDSGLEGSALGLGRTGLSFG